MTKRDIEYLLDKYDTKQPGEKWSKTTEGEYVKDYNYKQKLFIFDQLNNDKFLQEEQKTRAEYLIKHFDFNSLGNYRTSEIILMIMLYVKIEYTNTNFSTYKYYLTNHSINVDKFVNFLIKLNKHHCKHSYL